EHPQPGCADGKPHVRQCRNSLHFGNCEYRHRSCAESGSCDRSCDQHLSGRNGASRPVEREGWWKMNAAGIYQSRVTTAEEAVKVIKSGDRIFLTGNVSVPQTLL